MENIESHSQHPSSGAERSASHSDDDFWDELGSLEDYELAEMTRDAPPEPSDSQHAAIPNPAGNLANWSEMCAPETAADLSLLNLQELFNLGVKVLDKRNRESHPASNVGDGPTESRYATQETSAFPDMAPDPGDAVLLSYMGIGELPHSVPSAWSERLPDPEPEREHNDDNKGPEKTPECERRWTEGFLKTLLALDKDPTAYEEWLNTAACPKTERDEHVIHTRCSQFYRLALRDYDPALVSGAGDVQHSQVKTRSEQKLEKELSEKIYKPLQTAEHVSSSGDQSWSDGADPDCNPPMMIVVDRVIGPSAITCQTETWLFPREVVGLGRGIYESWLDRRDMVNGLQVSKVIRETMGKIKNLRSDKYSHEFTRRDPYSTMLDMPRREDIAWPSGMSLKIRPHLDWTPECNTVFEMPKAWSVLYERLKPRYSSWLAIPPSEMPEGFPSLPSDRQVDESRSSTEDLGLAVSETRQARPRSADEDERLNTTKRRKV